MHWAPFLTWVFDPFLLLSNELGKAKSRNLSCFPVVVQGGNSTFWGFEGGLTSKPLSRTPTWAAKRESHILLQGWACPRQSLATPAVHWCGLSCP